MARQKRGPGTRERFSFWLDLTKDDEFVIADTISALKESRSFVRTIRDGIRLISDLRAGRTDVLLELFPFVREAIDDGRAGGNSDDTSAVQEQIARLERLLLAQDGGQVMAPVTGQVMQDRAGKGGPKPLAIPRPAATPIPDDDDMDGLLIVTRSKAPAGNSAQSFLDSAFAIAGMQ